MNGIWEYKLKMQSPEDEKTIVSNLLNPFKMKKQFLPVRMTVHLFLLMAFTGCAVFSLNSQSVGTELGLFTGLNYAQIKFDNQVGQEQSIVSPLVGLKAGAVADFGLTRNLSIRFEPMFLQKGYQRKFETFYPHPQNVEEKLRLSYIELPMLLRWKVATGRIQPYLVAGAEAGYLLDARQEFSEFGEKETFRVKENYQDFDYGVSFGGGVNVSLGKMNIFLEGRRSLGLADIDQSGFITVNSESWQFMGGVTFPLNPLPVAMVDCVCQDLRIRKGVFSVPGPRRVGGVLEIPVNIAVHYNLLCSPGTYPNECEGKILWERVGAPAGDFADPKAVEIVKNGEKTVSEICGRKKNADQGVQFTYQIRLPGKALPINGTLHFKVSAECPDGNFNGPVTSKLVIDTTKKDNIDYETSDIDGDGLTGAEEKNKGTSDERWDTDGDGVSDKVDKFPKNKNKK